MHEARLEAGHRIRYRGTDEQNAAQQIKIFERTAQKGKHYE